ncbi:MAG: sensor histidine kinase [Nocardioides sp.]
MHDTGHDKRDKIFHHWRVSLLLAALTATPIAAVLVIVPDTRDPGRAPMVADLVAGVLLLLAAVLFYLHWRDRPVVEEGRTVAATAIIGIQVLSGAGFSLASNVVSPQSPWGTAVDALSAAVALCLVACRRVERVGDPLLLGLGLGLVLAGLKGMGLVVPQLADLPVAAAYVALFVVLAAYLGVARAFLAERCLPPWAGLHLAAAVCLVGVGEVGQSVRWSEDLAAMTAGLALAMAAALWTSTTYMLVREGMEARRRRTAELEESLHHVESHARSVHEQLHEVKSTIAGVSNATRLLREHLVGPETRQRLERTIRAELDRIERLLAEGPGADPGPVDLDETLEVLLESHQARGQTIEWKPSGASVHGDRDDVAEVLNILLDNAAKHGGGVPSHVDVSHDSDEIRIAVRDEGPGVPQEMRERIFDWGARASTAPGQGIGLHVARRLVTQHGGSLTLADPEAHGSAFVVRLPAARRTEENHGRHAEHRA